MLKKAKRKELCSSHKAIKIQSKGHHSVMLKAHQPQDSYFIARKLRDNRGIHPDEAVNA